MGIRVGRFHSALIRSLEVPAGRGGRRAGRRGRNGSGPASSESGGASAEVREGSGWPEAVAATARYLANCGRPGPDSPASGAASVRTRGNPVRSRPASVRTGTDSVRGPPGFAQVPRDLDPLPARVRAEVARVVQARNGPRGPARSLGRVVTPLARTRRDRARVVRGSCDTVPQTVGGSAPPPPGPRRPPRTRAPVARTRTGSVRTRTLHRSPGGASEARIPGAVPVPEKSTTFDYTPTQPWHLT